MQSRTDANGEAEAFSADFARVYGELKRIAHRQLDGAPAPTLDTTGLVHEAWLKLSRAEIGAANDRNHFLALAARAMRQIVIDRARARVADKRGGHALHVVDIEEASGIAGAALSPEDLLRLDAALNALGAEDPRLAELVELRFFAGVSVEEIARLRGVSELTLNRDWRRVRAQLYADLHPGD